MDSNAQPQAENLNAEPQAEVTVNEQATPASTETEQQPKAELTPFELEVKYNKEVRKLSKDEAIAYAQKGMNYDHVFGELEGLRNDPAVKLVLKTAKEYHVSTDTLAEKWAEDLEAKIINEYAEENDLTPQKAKQELKDKGELADIKTELASLKAKLSANDDIAEFFKEHPDKTDKDVPDEVLKAYKEAQDSGKPIALNALYEKWEHKTLKARNAELEKQLGIKKANDANADSSMGAVEGALGFEGEISEEAIKKMSNEQIQANMPKLLAWMHRKKD
jgi:hypothetical protein